MLKMFLFIGIIAVPGIPLQIKDCIGIRDGSLNNQTGRLIPAGTKEKIGEKKEEKQDGVQQPREAT